MLPIEQLVHNVLDLHKAAVEAVTLECHETNREIILGPSEDGNIDAEASIDLTVRLNKPVEFIDIQIDLTR